MKVAILAKLAVNHQNRQIVNKNSNEMAGDMSRNAHNGENCRNSANVESEDSIRNLIITLMGCSIAIG